MRPSGPSWLKFLRVTWVTKLTLELRIFRLPITNLTQSQHYQKISNNFKILILDSERTWPSNERITTRILIVSQKELERDTTESKTKLPLKQKWYEYSYNSFAWSRIGISLHQKTLWYMQSSHWQKRIRSIYI